MSDEEIVSRALKEKAFFGHIVSRYENKLSRYIQRLGIFNAEDRQDVLQNIFIKVYRNLNDFDSSLSFSSWIYRIAHNEAITHYRKTRVRPEGHLVSSAENVFAVLESNEDDAGELFDQQINAQVLADALARIEEKYRSVLILRFFEHKEYDEISDILKIPKGSVGTRIHRGKQALKKAIAKKQVTI